MNGNPLSADLDLVLMRTRPLWEELRGRRLFVTGGTGFFGCWLLESFAWANQRLGLGAEMIVLTRNLEAFRKKAPHLANRADIQFHTGDVRDFAFPDGPFSHIIHMAVAATIKQLAENPKLAVEIMVKGTERVLDFAARCGANKLLFTSSGSVYGPQPPDMARIAEDYAGVPDLSNARMEGKLKSEMLCAIASQRHGIQIKIARCFTFVGPYLELDAGFAIVDFINDALHGRPIKVKSDGTPYRSYLYAADLAAWLWTILLRGAGNRPYNVGSSQPITIAETAAEVARAIGEKTVVSIAQQPVPGRPAPRYVPNIDRAANELQLLQWTQLDDAIRATALWHRQRRSS
jgi:nucleoside-diphosphate-sugar epimerase